MLCPASTLSSVNIPEPSCGDPHPQAEPTSSPRWQPVTGSWDIAASPWESQARGLSMRSCICSWGRALWDISLRCHSEGTAA